MKFTESQFIKVFRVYYNLINLRYLIFLDIKTNKTYKDKKKKFV